eukprot:scaffold731_cov261-Pinguiococcus_pyrenoidosus.AAC.54
MSSSSARRAWWQDIPGGRLTIFLVRDVGANEQTQLDPRRALLFNRRKHPEEAGEQRKECQGMLPRGGANDVVPERSAKLGRDPVVEHRELSIGRMEA